jgi:hypothetical protein
MAEAIPHAATNAANPVPIFNGLRIVASYAHQEFTHNLRADASG